METTLELLTPEQTETQNRIEKLINRLENKEESLSYSSIKNLDSPINFINYKIKDWKPRTESQILGSACDLLLLTPELFDKEMAVLGNIPTTDKQIDFCETLIKKIKDSETKIEITDDFYEEEIFINAFSEHYQRGKPVSVSHLTDYVKVKLSGKEIISKGLKIKADKICDNLKNQKDFMDALNKTTERQKRLDFEFLGWKFKSFLDTYSPGLFQDLKFASDCTPDKFEYDLRKFSYDVQFGTYSLGLEILGEPTPEFEFLVYDAKGNYSILPVDYAYIKYAQRKVEFLVRCLDKMIEEKSYFSSYNFFNPHLTIYKPKWIKGFDFEIFE